ncbi:MAG: AAA family ATPase [Nanoarchaeota archaeon]|nr:AAA family ATPase [Nanoarchaeota archaeon]MBU1004726.1 AAA family ATPase [Nanoarchaeota archaeon]MBU1945343.1 AAA family ATPase [Nanoarchaeota archaeon]
MIIGLTGTMGSGKGEVVKFLKSKGFEHYVYSDILKEIAEQRNIEPTRANLQKLGSDIKSESNNLGILSKEILKRIKTDKAIADGIRNVDEIKELRKRKDVFIIGVTAPQKIRYSRITKRKRPGDPKTFSEFKRLDNLENRGKSKGQEINNCLKTVDFTIINTSSLEQLKNKMNDILGSISSQK